MLLNTVENYTLVTISDPEQDAVNEINTLMQTYDLTSREAEVVKAVCNGQSVAQVAMSIGIKENAVRFHLKNIYQKLQVNGQTQLVSKVLSNAVSVIAYQLNSCHGWLEVECE